MSTVEVAAPVVYEEEIDPDYEPTQKEIEEYAGWIGLDLTTDKALLWIAREGLKAPLPDEWRPCRSSEGELYYFNFVTGKSSWQHPCDEYYKELFQEEKRRQLTGYQAKDDKQMKLFSTSAARGPLHSSNGHAMLALSASAPSRNATSQPGLAPGSSSASSFTYAGSANAAALPWKGLSFPTQAVTQLSQPHPSAHHNLHHPTVRQGVGQDVALSRPATAPQGIHALSNSSVEKGMTSGIEIKTSAAAPALKKPSTAPNHSASASSSPAKRVTWQDLVSTDLQPTAELPAKPLARAGASPQQAGVLAGRSLNERPGQYGSSYAQQMQVYKARLAAAEPASASGHGEGGQGGAQHAGHGHAVDIHNDTQDGPQDEATTADKLQARAHAPHVEMSALHQEQAGSCCNPNLEEPQCELQTNRDLRPSGTYEMVAAGSGVQSANGVQCIPQTVQGPSSRGGKQEHERPFVQQPHQQVGDVCAGGTSRLHTDQASADNDSGATPAEHGAQGVDPQYSPSKVQSTDPARVLCSNTAATRSSEGCYPAAGRGEGGSTTTTQQGITVNPQHSPASVSQPGASTPGEEVVQDGSVQRMVCCPGTQAASSPCVSTPVPVTISSSQDGQDNTGAGYGGVSAWEDPAHPGQRDCCEVQRCGNEHSTHRGGSQASKEGCGQADAAWQTEAGGTHSSSVAEAKGRAEALHRGALCLQEEASRARHQLQVRLDSRHLDSMRAGLRAMKENAVDINRMHHAGGQLIQAALNSTHSAHGCHPQLGLAPEELRGTHTNGSEANGAHAQEGVFSATAGASAPGAAPAWGGAGCGAADGVQDGVASEVALVKRMEECLKVLQRDLGVVARL